MYMFENRITIEDDDNIAGVVGGVGIYKKDSLLNDSTSQYMAGTNTFNDLKGHQADLKPYSFYTVYLPYWATCLSSDFPNGMPSA